LRPVDGHPVRGESAGEEVEDAGLVFDDEDAAAQKALLLVFPCLRVSQRRLTTKVKAE
jgi:hypothetical protein